MDCVKPFTNDFNPTKRLSQSAGKADLKLLSGGVPVSVRAMLSQPG
jgi:hypothetical protein